LHWKFHTGDAVIASPVLGDGALYIGSTDNYMYALFTNASLAQAGSVKWQKQTFAPILAAAALGPDKSSLFFISDTIYALDVSDGHALWKSQIQCDMNPQVPPLVGPDLTVYASCRSDAVGIYGAGPNTGTLKFIVDFGGQNFGSMALGADGSLYFNAGGVAVAAYTSGPLAGKVNWYSTYLALSTNVFLSNANSTLIAGTWNNTIFGICTQGPCTSQLQWSITLGGGATSHLFSAGTASSDGSRLFVGSLDHVVYCIALG